MFERRNMDLTNEKWEVLEPLIPAPVRRADGRGRLWRNSRDVLNGILWVLRTGAPGATCQNATRLTRRVTDASSGGTKKTSASPHEVTLVEATLAANCAREEPERLVGDRAYDSDPLDESLAERGIEMIAPHRRNRKKPKTQEGRKLRRYKRRWKIERLFAWLGNFRRLVVRYERRAENYLGLVRVGCIVILLRYM